MTVKKLALNWIEHANETPEEITVEEAARFIDWMDPDTDLPADLTPEAFAAAWNDILRGNV